jgi:dihydrofolate synthase / folylpolyglutamate synthase
MTDDSIYKDTLKYIFEKLPMYHLIGATAYKEDIGNITQLCELHGNPHLKFRSVHVAGTNGKGSFSHILASVLAECGYKTGLFTSPHLLDFRERIRINGEIISKDYVIDYVNKNKFAIEEIQPSFFEITTDMAFSYFVQENINIAVIETGLGGRLDATNILKPEFCVITNISLDHEYLLGKSIEQIAYEKAGIFKEQTAVVIGERDSAAVPVFTKTAFLKKSPLYYAEDYFHVESFRRNNSDIEFKIRDLMNGSDLLLQTDLPGTYQGNNIVTVLKSLDLLKEKNYHLPIEKVYRGIKKAKENTGLRGRWEIISTAPLTVCDISHNPVAIAETIKQVSGYSYDNLHIIFGISADKNLEIMLEKLPLNATYYFCKSSVPRAMDADKLCLAAMEKGLNGKPYSTVCEAFREAKNRASPGDFILITGSNFVVADLLAGNIIQ